MLAFRVKKKLHQARLTELKTSHGVIDGPFFQFVATRGAIRGQVFSEDLEKLGVQIILANTFHLHLRPGEDVVAEAGGLHRFMQWDGPITTDSGGYQVFSLNQGQRLDETGVTFRSPTDGSYRRLTPEAVIGIQQKLGADIIMPLDVCTPYRATHGEITAAVDLTIAWAKRCKEALARLTAKSSPPVMLYGIIQGGIYPDIRKRCANELRDVGFSGYAIGGELRDEEQSSMDEGLRATLPHLPADAPRYQMGAGTPEDIVRAVRLGVDQFDCVLPVRNARHGELYYDLNHDELAACLHDPERPVSTALYRSINLRKSQWARNWQSFAPNNPTIPKAYTMSYVHHLLRAEPPSGYRLAVLHNIFFYCQLMQAIREVLK